MATEKKPAEAESVKTANEPKYTLDKLRQNSVQLFGVTKSTFDGAMYGHGRKEFTINEVKAILKRWLYGKEGKR